MFTIPYRLLLCGVTTSDAGRALNEQSSRQGAVVVTAGRWQGSLRSLWPPTHTRVTAVGTQQPARRRQWRHAHATQLLLVGIVAPAPRRTWQPMTTWTRYFPAWKRASWLAATRRAPCRCYLHLGLRRCRRHRGRLHHHRCNQVRRLQCGRHLRWWQCLQWWLRHCHCRSER